MRLYLYIENLLALTYCTVMGTLIADGTERDIGEKTQRGGMNRSNDRAYTTISRSSGLCTGIARNYGNTKPRSNGSSEMNSGTSGTEITALQKVLHTDPRAMATSMDITRW